MPGYGRPLRHNRGDPGRDHGPLAVENGAHSLRMIRSLLDLFPHGEIVVGISDDDARAANEHVIREHGERGAGLFIGRPPGLRVIDVDGVVVSSDLDGQMATRDLPFWPSGDRAVLEAHVTTPSLGHGLRIALIDLPTPDSTWRNPLRKAMMMDVDVAVIGILGGIPEEGGELWGALFTGVEVGMGIVGIIAADRPAGRLRHLDYLAFLQRMGGSPGAGTDR
jgi:hypothetical protein